MGRGGGGPESDTLDCCGSAQANKTVAGRCLRSVVLCALGSAQLAAAFCSHVVSSGVKLCRNKSEIHTLE